MDAPAGSADSEVAPAGPAPGVPEPVPDLAGSVAVPPVVGEDGGVASGADGGVSRAGPGIHHRPGWFSPSRLVIVIVLVAASVTAWLLTRPSAPAYRTAVVGTGTAVASLNSVGTIAPVNQASLDFNVSGTVGAVDVAVGQQVSAGEVVASLESTPLENSVVTAQASLASAQATLAGDEASQAAAATTASATPSTTTTTTSTTVPSTGTGSSGQGNQEIAKLQATLVADQKLLDGDSAAASGALTEAATVCNSPAPTAAAQPGFTPPPPGAPTTTTTVPGGSGTPPSCSQALSLASAAQAKVSADVKTVNQDLSALTSALGPSGSGSASGSAGSGSGTGGAGSGTSSSSGGAKGTSVGSGTTSPAVAAAGSGATGGSAAAGTGSTSSKARVVTPQKLDLDQASIDVAQADLTNAQQAVGAATLVSTISGTVGSVTITPGSTVTAGATTSTPQVVVIGSGSSYQAATTVPVAKIGQVAVGQQVLVTPDSTGTVLNGTVTAIGVLATSGSTSTVYPVTVTLEASSLGLYSGAEAQLAIVTGRAVGATTVPTSAVRTVGSQHVVTVVDGATTKAVRVTLGTVGTLLTQVTSGVKTGQLVTLASLDEPVPSSSTTSTRTGLGGFGGTGGAGGTGGFGGGAGSFRSGALGG